ncbi:hypothetical protein [Catenuloplanes japonicus]|uniref:hypothetical protein n=1 Tax=Catenuloplanes japonicus TaxID=33876 RepID=UPI0005270201|nr:hypothetical protein [Catenuloplanes japonicus]
MRRLEDLRYRPDDVADALDSYGRLLHRPGRWLDGDALTSPGCEPEDARDLLDDVLRRLPRGAREDLARVVTRMDDEFVRRTLPALSWTDWAAGRWWYQRDREV